MKMRILNDSIRLRLERDEVDAIGRGEAVDAATHFPGAVMHYVLKQGPSAGACLDGQAITVIIPHAEADAWAHDDAEVSIRATIEIDNGRELSLLVEKDFECLEPREGESQENRFSNPKAQA